MWREPGRRRQRTGGWGGYSAKRQLTGPVACAAVRWCRGVVKGIDEPQQVAESPNHNRRTGSVVQWCGSKGRTSAANQTGMRGVLVHAAVQASANNEACVRVCVQRCAQNAPRQALRVVSRGMGAGKLNCVAAGAQCNHPVKAGSSNNHVRRGECESTEPQAVACENQAGARRHHEEHR